MRRSDPASTRTATRGPRAALEPPAGNGYRNPVLFADYSDPDAIRVGDDYWLTASSFNHAPGLPILHSRDMVNWTLVNYALPRLVPAAHFAVPRHGGGVWAPALRFHAGRYWIYYPDPDFGLYVITAEHPAARWSEPVPVKAGRGLIDPCPFWDDDGAGYLIHGWAKSRSGIKNRLTLHRLRPDNRGVADAGEVVIDGDRMEGWSTIEGPKLYKRSGYYYIFAPAGGVRDGYQAVFRARNLRGPYESRIVLAQGRTAINGPHQGAWVDTPAGEDWFLHFQEQPAFGRVVHLQPVVWRDDWPLIGHGDGEGPGEPVAQCLKPAAGAAPAGERAANGSGAAAGSTLAQFGVPELDWQWEANPAAGWLAVVGSTWRVACVPLPEAANLWSAGHLLLRKFAGPGFVATVQLALDARHDGERAGLLVFGQDYAWLGLRRDDGRTRLVFCTCAAAHQHGDEHIVAVVGEPAGGGAATGGPAPVELRVSVDAAARCQFAYRGAGGGFCPVGPEFQARSGHWVGAKVGVFAAGPGGADAADVRSGPGNAAGRAIVTGFRLEPRDLPAAP